MSADAGADDARMRRILLHDCGARFGNNLRDVAGRSPCFEGDVVSFAKLFSAAGAPIFLSPVRLLKQIAGTRQGRPLDTLLRVEDKPKKTVKKRRFKK